LSHTSVFGTPPKLPDNSCHIPANRSPVVRDGSNTAAMNPDHAATIVSTGGAAHTSSATRTTLGGNHRSHCTISPGRYSVRSAGSAGANNGRSSATLARSTEGDRVHPIRSAITVAGIVGVLANNARICGSNASTTDPARARSYFGGPSEDNAARTVFLATPNWRAIALIAIFSDL